MTTDNPLTVGRVALANAMIRKGHSPADAARATKTQTGTITNVLSGARGVGVDLGARIEAEYGIAAEAFREKAPKGTKMPKVPSGAGRRVGRGASPAEAA